MRYLLWIAALAAVLSGCVVVPYGGYYDGPAYYGGAYYQGGYYYHRPYYRHYGYGYHG